MLEELDRFATCGVSDATTTSLDLDLVVIANQFANREYGSADSHMFEFDRDLLIVYLTLTRAVLSFLRMPPQAVSQITGLSLGS